MKKKVFKFLKYFHTVVLLKTAHFAEPEMVFQRHCLLFGDFIFESVSECSCFSKSAMTSFILHNVQTALILYS